MFFSVVVYFWVQIRTHWLADPAINAGMWLPPSFILTLGDLRLDERRSKGLYISFGQTGPFQCGWES